MDSPYLLFVLLIIALGLFIWGKWRYDIVSLFALMVATLIGIVPFNKAFAGLENPAVITVACVMVISQAITQSGIVNNAVQKLASVTTSTTLLVGSLTLIAAVLSAFMNNVGALALLMPVAIQMAYKNKRSPTLVLMPLALGAALGGLTTVIGTPPNILIATYRQNVTGYAFSMFDFTPVGVVIAIIGVIFIALLGWRLLPSKRKGTQKLGDLFRIEDYIAEVKVPASSPIVNNSFKKFKKLIKNEFSVVGLIRKGRKSLSVRSRQLIRSDDILLIRANHEDLQALIRVAKLESTSSKFDTELLSGDGLGLLEAVVTPTSSLEGRSSKKLRLYSRYHITLLAISRRGRAFKQRLNEVRFQAGDVILLQGEAESLEDTAVSLGLLPLIERGLSVVKSKLAYFPAIVFALAIILTAIGFLPIAISFAAAVVVLLISGFMSPRKVYRTIDWSVIILLAAMIPLAQAMQDTGGALLITKWVMDLVGQSAPIVVLAVLMILTMLISDLMNNAATAIIMAPIAVSLANALNVNIDPFLMGVAVASSCSFLTPIGHQNNTLILGPGGYKFSDYIRLGLPVEILVLLVGLPMLVWVWPFK